MLSFRVYGGHGLSLKVIAGTNIPVPSNRTPTAHYVHVSTPYGQRNTTTKPAMANGSISWNETLTIHGRPPTFSKWLTSIFSRNSKVVHLEIRASYESGPQDEVVGRLETTVQQLLVNGEQSVSLSTVDNQCIYLKLNARLADHAAGGTAAESVVIGQPARPPVVQSTPQESSSNHVTHPRARNVVIFGETGSGKSSLINAIAEKQLAKTSNDALGCTPKSERHSVHISGQRYVLIDTAGLHEGTAGTVPAATAKKQLKNLLHELMSSRSPSGGIDLLVYCVRSTTAPRALVRDYNTFYSGDCRKKKVPIVLVVTGLEGDTENWWDLNKENFKSMHFSNHACVPTPQGYPDTSDSVVTHPIAPSSKILRDLVVNNCSDPAVDSSWSEGLWCRSPSWSED